MGTRDMYRIIFSTSYQPYTITCQCSNFRFSCGYYRIFLFIISSVLNVWLRFLCTFLP